MYSGNQTTILNEVSFFGKPKNMEKVVNAKLLSSNEDSGITFKRVDIKENNLIKVSYDNLYIESDKLILKNKEGISINNFEILLSAIWAAKIDNLIIEIDGDSIPYIDGTAEAISFILSVGKIKELEKSRKIFQLEQEIGVKINNFEILAKPCTSFKINIKIGEKYFSFNNEELPFKDTLSGINENSEDKIKYDIIVIISIIYLSNKFCNFEVSFTNFDKKVTFDFFNNLFNKRIG